MKTAKSFSFFLLFWSLTAIASDEDGWFGIDLKAEGSGRFWNPIIDQLIVASVEPNSPAAETRIKPGDVIIEIEGQRIAGKRMRSLQPYFEKAPGEKISFALTTPAGETYRVTLVGKQRPD